MSTDTKVQYGTLELRLEGTTLEFYQHVAEAADVSLETVLAVMAAIHLVKTIQDQGGTLESAKVKVSESKE